MYLTSFLGSAKRWISPTRAPRAKATISRTPHSRTRSEEHTSELQSRSDLVCRLLLEKKKKKKYRRRLFHEVRKFLISRIATTCTPENVVHADYGQMTMTRCGHARDASIRVVERART